MTHIDRRARDAAFAQAHPPGSASGDLAYSQIADANLLADLVARGIAHGPALAAIGATRALRDAAIAIADEIRDRPVSRAVVLDHFRRLAPGFTDEQYDAALATGMLLTR